MQNPSNGLLISQIFPSVGKPTITYVQRNEGENERLLLDGLRSMGQICILTGPSKTGKTSLYKKIVPEISKSELIIRCSKDLTAGEFWSRALQQLDFKRIYEETKSWGINCETEIGVDGEFGWSWFAKVTGKFTQKFGGNKNSEDKYQYINAEVSASDLVPLLTKLPVQLVVEDFHYLPYDTQVEIFQQWKQFVDEGVSVLVVGTTHRAIDIARANSDLTGRVRIIETSSWSQNDLKLILKAGFEYLDIKLSNRTLDIISEASVGLPILTQQIAHEVCSSKLIRSKEDKPNSPGINLEDVNKAMSTVCTTLYATYDTHYDRLIVGPRKLARKYDTYLLILASFVLEPVSFTLDRSTLTKRINILPIEADKRPPPAAVNASLKALLKFQEKMGVTLLEWFPNDNRLYVTEPSFLFYLRQKLASYRNSESKKLTSSDILSQLLKILESNAEKTITNKKPGIRIISSA
jgi:hypothetical protein